MPKVDLDALRRTPAYPFSEAAHYLNLPTSTLRSWCLGQAYTDSHGHPKLFRALISLDGERSQGLSFLNLIEAHVLAAIRRLHHIPLPKVRDALSYVEGKLQLARPLAAVEFQTNGVDLFVERLGELLVNVSRDGQIEFADLMKAHLRRVKRDTHGVPIKLYLFTRKSATTTEGKPPVEVDPRVAFGRPVLAGRAVPTAVLADRFKAGDSLSELARDYDTSTSEIEEAIRCELDRRKAA